MPGASGGALDTVDPSTPWVNRQDVFTNTSGRVRINPRATAGTRVVIGVGQSTIGGTEDTIHTLTNANAIDNLFINDGGVYRAVEPLLGTVKYLAGGCWLTRFADQLVTAGKYSRIILVPISINGAQVSLWAKGGALHQRLLSAFGRCAQQSYNQADIDVFYMQGESDTFNGTSQAVYQASLLSAIAGVRSAGYTSRWFVSKTSYYQGSTSAAVRAAQTAVISGTDILAGPDTDTLGSTYRHDNVHWNATGAEAVATLWKTAYLAATP